MLESQTQPVRRGLYARNPDVAHQDGGWLQGIQMCCITLELQRAMRNRQTCAGCTQPESAGTQLAPAFTQKEMKRKK